MSAGSGPRYTDWSHLHVRGGDKDAAAPYIPAARKLLGFVMSEAKRAGLGVYKLERVLPDGTIIIAEKIGDIPRMTIIPGGRAAPKELRTLEGFFFARRNGADVDATSVVLRPPSDDAEDSKWVVAFYSDESDGYDLVPEDERSTYMDVFGQKAKEPWERLETGGGIWVDRDTKEAVTWFRGYLGYWPMHYRHPATNYARAVSIYGHLVYSTPYDEWRVLAAAKRGMYLYVLIAENLGALNPPVRPGAADESGQAWFSQPFTDDLYTYSLWRYPLSVETQPDTLIDTYKAAQHEDADQLWQGDLELAYGAWSFNADCTSVVTVQLPRRCILKLHTYLDVPHNLWAHSRDSWPDYPEVEAQRIELTIEHGAEGPPSVSMSQSLAAETIAEEDGKILKFVLADYEMDAAQPGVTNYARMEYQCGGFSAVAYEATRGGAPGGGPNPFLNRVLVYAHLPSMTFLFLRTELGGGAPTENVDIRYELYINGEEVELDDPYTFNGPIPSGEPFSDDPRQRVDTPWYGVLDVAGDFALRIDMDAITQLYAIRFLLRDSAGSLVSDGPHQQAYLYVAKPYVLMTIRLNVPAVGNFGGAVAEHTGAGGWSFSEYGGPGPTFAWESANLNAMGTYFNRGQYLDPEPNLGPAPCPFGYAMVYENKFVAAVKNDVWMAPSTLEGEPSPYPFINEFYVLRTAATDGENARALIDAIDPRLNDIDTVYYNTFPIGHTGKPMKRQQTRISP